MTTNQILKCSFCVKSLQVAPSISLQTMVIELVGFGQSLHAFEISYHKHVLGLMVSMYSLIVAIALLCYCNKNCQVLVNAIVQRFTNGKY